MLKVYTIMFTFSKPKSISANLNHPFFSLVMSEAIYINIFINRIKFSYCVLFSNKITQVNVTGGL